MTKMEIKYLKEIIKNLSLDREGLLQNGNIEYI